MIISIDWFEVSFKAEYRSYPDFPLFAKCEKLFHVWSKLDKIKDLLTRKFSNSNEPFKSFFKATHFSFPSLKTYFLARASKNQSHIEVTVALILLWLPSRLILKLPSRFIWAKISIFVLFQIPYLHAINTSNEERIYAINLIEI